jgi:HK97 family phage prohead protease
MRMIDIGDRKRLAAAPAIRFTTVGEPVVSTEPRTLGFVFSDESIDRYGDIIQARGWVLANFNANPVALFGHDAGSVENVIGRARNVRVNGTQLVGDIEFMTAEVNPNAEAVFRMLQGGFLKTVSVGFAPLEWEQAKDKTRPGGIDFKRQELLEISVVPIPANPNALVQAKAAGIDVERLGLQEVPPATRVAVVTRKGLYSVGYLAQILCDLGYLQDSVAWEAEYEGDGSKVPAALMDAMKALGQVLIDMTAEEVGELLAGDDEDELVVMLSAPAAEARAELTRDLLKFSPGELIALSSVADSPFALLRAGKAISAANEKKLRAAHGHITSAAQSIGDVLDPPDDEDPKEGADGDDESTEDEDKALRARKASARKRKVAQTA